MVCEKIFRWFVSIGYCIPRRQAQGDQLGYVEFTDASSASKSIMQYQGYLGLGGRGLALEPTQYTLGQLTGQPAIGLLADGGRVVNAAAAQKRQRDGGEFLDLVAHIAAWFAVVTLMWESTPMRFNVSCRRQQLSCNRASTKTTKKHV